MAELLTLSANTYKSMKENNVVLTVKIELSQDTYNHIENVVDIGEHLKRAAEKVLYTFIMEDVQR